MHVEKEPSQRVNALFEDYPQSCIVLTCRALSPPRRFFVCNNMIHVIWRSPFVCKDSGGT